MELPGYLFLLAVRLVKIKGFRIALGFPVTESLSLLSSIKKKNIYIYIYIALLVNSTVDFTQKTDIA